MSKGKSKDYPKWIYPILGGWVAQEEIKIHKNKKHAIKRGTGKNPYQISFDKEIMKLGGSDYKSKTFYS